MPPKLRSRENAGGPFIDISKRFVSHDNDFPSMGDLPYSYMSSFDAYKYFSQHKEFSIKLKDPSKPGSRHLISLQLVDPSMRIISTANVPPQQRDWWLGAVMRQSLQPDAATLPKLPPDLVAILEQKNMSGEGLPVEIWDMVRAYLHSDESSLPMTEEEARKHRAEVLQERIEHHTRAGLSWGDIHYQLFRR